MFGYLHSAAGTWHPKAPGEWVPLDHTAAPLTLTENPLLAASFLSLSSQGISKECEGEEISLGRFVYNKTGNTVQTFELQVTSARVRLLMALSLGGVWGFAFRVS